MLSVMALVPKQQRIADRSLRSFFAALNSLVINFPAVISFREVPYCVRHGTVGTMVRITAVPVRRTCYDMARERNLLAHPTLDMYLPLSNI